MKHQYTPAWWVPGPHLRTLWGKFFRRAPELPTRRERWETPDGDFVDVVRLDASANGNLASVAKLLWRIESARLPLKVDDLDLRSRTDGADDLAVSFKVSTIWVTPGEPANKGPAARPVRPAARGPEDL